MRSRTLCSAEHTNLRALILAPPQRCAGDLSVPFAGRGDPPSSDVIMMCSDAVMSDVAARTAASAAPDEEEEPQLCVICLEAVKDDATFLSCAHVYHRACISRWLQRAPRCPQCGVAAGPLAAGSLDVRLQSAESQLLAVRQTCLLYTSPSPRDQRGYRMPSSA